jgi:hypothetical protein
MNNAQGVSKNYPQTAFMQRGTSPLNMWYCGTQNQTAFASNGSTVLNSIKAFQFLLSRPVSISKISMECTGGVPTAVCRIGIYSATSLNNVYPSALMVDSGEFDLSVAAVKTSNVSLQLPAGLYWFAYLAGVAAANFRRYVAGVTSSVMGSGSNLNSPLAVVEKAQAYGALPSTFPAAATSNAAASTDEMVIALEFA